MKYNNLKGAVAVLAIDLAKQSFQLHGVDANGSTVLTKKLNRNKLSEFIAQLPTCLIGIEACGGSNYWARVFKRHGHTVRMIAPQFVKPFVKSNKNDAVDAEAICEAVQKARYSPACREHFYAPFWDQLHHRFNQLVAADLTESAID